MNAFILFLVGGIGALSTFIVSHDLKQGAVRASAGLSLLVGIVFYAFPHLVPGSLSIEIPLVFFGASFVGMTGSHLVPQKLLIALGGVIFSGTYLAAGAIFNGDGGKLGTAACIASLLMVAISLIIRKKRIS